MEEEYDKDNGQRVLVKLTQKDLSQLLNGKILEGHKVSVGMDNNLNKMEVKK